MNSLTLPSGFRYASAFAGIRREDRADVALIVADAPAQAAAVFTTNVVQAAPVQLSRKHLRQSGGKVSAILINAGNANCATRTGMQVALESAKAVASALKTRTEYVLTASTGVIGVELEPKPLLEAVPKLVQALSGDQFYEVAKAMMTTDTRPKVASEELEIEGRSVRVAGLTKGSGMIHPNMATTLGFLMTDAVLPSSVLREMLSSGLESSFHALTVDGDTSTNDMVALLASGASLVKPLGKTRERVAHAVRAVLESLAELIAADGEGATRLVVIEAVGFSTNEDARKVARAIANSPLVKTAVAGCDPNWGRVLAAAGYSGVSFDPTRIDIDMQGVPVCRGGLAVELNEDSLKRRLDEHRVDIRVELRRGGKGQARFYTCDLTEGYIRINGSYRT